MADDKSSELKQAEESAAIAKALKEKAEYEKAAADALKAKAEAEKDTFQTELERDKLQATRELSLAEAQAGIFAKLLPKGDVKPLEGKVDVKDVAAITRLVAYHALGKGAADIVKALDAVLQDSDKVMVVPQLDFASGDMPLLEIMEHFDLYGQSISLQIQANEKILESPVPAAAAMAAAPLTVPLLAMAGTLIPGLANLAGYFKTDYSITGYDFDLDKEGLAARVAGELSKKRKNIYYYNFYPLWDLNLPIIEKLAQLSAMSLNLQYSKDKLTEKIKVDRAEGKDTAVADKALSDSQALLDACKNYVQSITTKAAGEDFPRLVRAALRDRVRKMEITHLLYLNVTPKSAGESITKRSIWRNTKFVSYLGGVALTYILAAVGQEGRIVCGDTLVKLSVYDYLLVAPGKSTLESIPFGN